MEKLDTEITDLKDKCPAFMDKCPFDKPELKSLVEEAKKCPAFKEECMFKNAATLQDVYKQLSDIPDMKEGSAHQKALVEVLKVIHSVSNELKEEMGECPVFKTKAGCPFKTVCSDGKPLVEKLKDFHWEHLVHDAVIEVKEELYADMSREKQNTSEKPSEKTEDVKLSSHLKVQLSKDHRQASTSHFIKDLLRGRIEQKIYQQYVAALYFIYRALEEEAEKHASHEIFGKIHSPDDLARLDTLKEDLKYYFGDDWEVCINMSEATQNYVERLREVGQNDPLLLVAHHYIRYVGDLSGGQVLKKVAIKTYGLSQEGEGVSFYEFKKIPNYSKYKDQYRGKLDALDIDKQTADRLVEESRFAYNLNVALFKEMDVLAGFEEEIIHEEVNLDSEDKDATDNSVDIKNVPEQQKKQVRSDYMQWVKTAGVSATQDTSSKERSAQGTSSKDRSVQDTSSKDLQVNQNPIVDLLKIFSAIAIAVAVLVGFTLKMMDQK